MARMIVRSMLSFVLGLVLQVSAVPDWLVANVSTPPTFNTNADGSYTLSNGRESTH